MQNVTENSLDLLNQGCALMAQQQYEQALEKFSLAQKDSPKSIDCYINLGNVYSCLEKYDDALENFKKALILDEKSSTVLFDISERVKPMNEQIYYLVDNINTAINHRKQISFRYFHYDQHRKEVPNNDGKRYRFSPYFLVWNEDHYYTVGYSEKHQKIGTFRVDRMKEVNILTADAVEKPTDFNLPEFTRQVFDMYDGSSETVTLLCKNDMMNYIVDRFGDAVETSPIDYEHFAAVAEVSVSQTFFAWVFQFDGDIQIKSPELVVDRYKAMLTNALGK